LGLFVGWDAAMTHAAHGVAVAPTGYDALEVAERQAFLELGAQDCQRLSAIHGQMEPFGSEFAGAFYSHLLSFPALRQMLPDEQSLERLKRAQSDYFSRLTVGEYGHDYVANRLRIGQVHHRFGLEPKWYIGAYRKYLSGLMPLVWAQCDGDVDGFLAIYDSLLKVVLFDMGLALDSYFQADRQALQEMKDYADRVICTMPSGLLVVDRQLRLRTINLAAREMLGLDEGAQLVGQTLWQILDNALLLEVAREVLAKSQSSRALTLGPLPELGGRILAVTLSATLIEEAPALILQFQDETESVRAEENLSRFRTALDASHDAIFIIDRADMRFVDMNSSACSGLGYTRQELLAMGPADIKPQLSTGELEKLFDQVLAAPDQAGRIETLHLRKDGSTFPVEVVLRAFRSEGRPMLVAVARDCSERARTESSLLLARRALETSSNCIVVTDCQQPDNPIVYVNPAFERMTGYSAAEVIGSNCRFLHGSDRHQPGTAELRRAIQDQAEASVVLRNYRKDGSLFWNQLYVAPVRNDLGLVTHYVGFQNDISEQKQAEENLLHMATHDALTHLPNRTLLQDRLSQAISYAQRMQHQVGVLFIDVDRFKNINDSLGHAAGDQLIVEIARRLSAAVRAVDTVARIGGDEFVVILTDVGRESDITQVLPNLFSALTQPVWVDDHQLAVTASVGISVYPRDGLDGPTLLKNADTAMYRDRKSVV
jgi:diguanylate cyclase (GGDEF)-like protein/PAS domain S-box-containing protein